MVTVIGLGFVGLTTALGIAELGNKVYGIESDPSKLQRLQNGEIPFMEPMLQEMLNKHKGEKLLPGECLEKAVAESETIFFCVGTPYGINGEVDLTYLYEAINQVIDAIHDERFRCFVIKSSVPPSTTVKKIIPFIKSKGRKVPEQIGVAVNPEFLREGHCWEDFINTERIVLGIDDKKSEKVLRDLYSKFSDISCVSYNTAEFIKYLSNSSLACLISFANEMSLAANAIGDIDIAEAFTVVHKDKRWQNGSIRSYFYPGCGYGGYCLPKDTNALYYDSFARGYDCRILKQVIETNDSMPKQTAGRIINATHSNRDIIAILGLSFNPGSDDVRDTPAAKIIRELNNKGYKNIIGYDPCAMDNFKKTYPDLDCRYAADYEEAKSEADILAIVTVWDIFRDLRSSDRTVVDCRYSL